MPALKRAVGYALVVAGLMSLTFLAAVCFVAGAVWMLGRLV